MDLSGLTIPFGNPHPRGTDADRHNNYLYGVCSAAVLGRAIYEWILCLLGAGASCGVTCGGSAVTSCETTF